MGASTLPQCSSISIPPPLRRPDTLLGTECRYCQRRTGISTAALQRSSSLLGRTRSAKAQRRSSANAANPARSGAHTHVQLHSRHSNRPPPLPPAHALAQCQSHHSRRLRRRQKYSLRAQSQRTNSRRSRRIRHGRLGREVRAHQSR